jgi:segregation and condensation protein B
MVPPKLNIVHESDDDFDQTEHDDTEQREPAAASPPAQTNPSQPVSAVAAAAAARALAGTSAPHPLPSNIGKLPSADRGEKLRILEALLFAAAEPLDEKSLAQHLKISDDVLALLAELQGFYAGRGVNLVRVSGKWSFRTASDLSYLLERHASEERRLSKAAMETLAIIGYHQPVTRAEIEEIRGVQTSAGTLDVLMATGWIRPRGRRRAPGRPITYGTTENFLEHFGLDAIKDLPGLAELKGSGLLDSNLPPDFMVPEPTDVAALMPDELPLDAGEEVTMELPLDEELDDGDAGDDTGDAKA